MYVLCSSRQRPYFRLINSSLGRTKTAASQGCPSKPTSLENICKDEKACAPSLEKQIQDDNVICAKVVPTKR